MTSVKKPDTAPDFPIPYASQAPADDLALARQFMRVAYFVVEDDADRGRNQEEVRHVRLLLETVDNMLTTLQRYLDDEEAQHPGTRDRYGAARRAEIVENSRRCAI